MNTVSSKTIDQSRVHRHKNHRAHGLKKSELAGSKHYGRIYGGHQGLKMTRLRNLSKKNHASHRSSHRSIHQSRLSSPPSNSYQMPYAAKETPSDACTTGYHCSSLGDWWISPHCIPLLLRLGSCCNGISSPLLFLPSRFLSSLPSYPRSSLMSGLPSPRPSPPLYSSRGLSFMRGPERGSSRGPLPLFPYCSGVPGKDLGSGPACCMGGKGARWEPGPEGSPCLMFLSIPSRRWP